MSPHLPRSTSVLALVSLLLAALLLAVRGLNLTVEFTGGMIIQVHYPEAAAAKSVQDTLVRAGVADASVKDINEYSYDFFLIFPPRDDVLSPQSRPHAVQQVIAALSTERRHVEVTGVEIVTPTMGRDVLLSGLASLSLLCIAILTYPAVRHGWPVAMTNIRNMAIVLGLFLSAYIVFQWEFSLLSLTAMGFLAITVTAVGTLHASRASRS
jgi:preprotein translocase subunit SecF